MAVSVASTLVSSQFDYTNSVLFGCPQKHTARLQRAQHALATAGHLPRERTFHTAGHFTETAAFHFCNKRHSVRKMS